MSKKMYTIKEEYSWLQLEKDIKKMAIEICKLGKPDMVICISTGGWIPGRLLKNHISADYLSIGCLAYNEEGNFTGEITITQELPNNISLEGKNILIVDEVCETGITLKTVANYLSSFNPNSIKSAVLHLKDHAKYKADFFVHLIKDKWIVYPWSNV